MGALEAFKIAYALLIIVGQVLFCYYAIITYKRIKRIEEKQKQFDEQQKVIIDSVLECQQILITLNHTNTNNLET